MSKQITGILKAPSGATLTNQSVGLVAIRSTPPSIVKGAKVSFTTDASGFYDVDVENGYFRVTAESESGGDIALGTIYINDGDSSDLPTLLSLSEEPDTPVNDALQALADSAAQSAVDAAASAASSTTTPLVASASRNQAMNAEPLSQGEAQRVGFSATTYTGNGTSQSISTGIDMASGANGGLFWPKSRSVAGSNTPIDSVRGAGNYLQTNTTAAEISGSDAAFTSTGVDLGAFFNGAGVDYVGWSWGTTKKTSGLTNRNKPYECHYNPDMGFSIVGYEGDGAAGHEIPHHLGVKPELIIHKNRTLAGNWSVASTYLANPKDGVLYLNLTDQEATASTIENIFSETISSKGADTNVNAANHNIISYHFASVEGVSKVGKYIGTGATGNYVECGFKPAFVMIKNLTTGSTNWETYDSGRGDNKILFPNDSAVEATVAVLDFTGDGFVHFSSANTRNALNDEYLFLAFADTNATTGRTDYSYPTTADTVTIDALVSYAEGFDSSGEVNSQEDLNTTFSLGTGFENKKLYLYKNKGGAVGVTEHRPLEQQDYSGVQSPLSDDPNMRTTAKHFDYESSTGVVSGDDDGINLVYNAFDKRSDPQAGTAWIYATGPVATLQYKHTEKRVLKSWRMREPAAFTRLPRRFTLEGSNDGLNWDTVDSTYTASDYTGNGATLWGGLQDLSINTTAYLYHRLRITDAQTGIIVSLEELELNTVLPSDRYDVQDGVMYDSTGTPIQRVYLGEFRTDSDGDVINETLVNYTPSKFKATEVEVHEDLTVHGEIHNQQVATAWVNFDGTQNPPLIRDSYNVKDVVDSGAGQYEVVFEKPFDAPNYSVQTCSGAQNNYYIVGTVGSVGVRTRTGAGALGDVSTVSVTIFGGKS